MQLTRSSLALAIVALGAAVAQAGPGDARTWEEDFEDNMDPVVSNPADWQYRSTNGSNYSVADGFVTWDGGTSWQLFDSQDHYFNGVTVIEMEWDQHPGIYEGTEDKGVGWWVNAGNDSLTSGTAGWIPINLFLGRDSEGQRLRFSDNFSGDSHDVRVAEGPVRTVTTITILGGANGALVETDIFDSSGEPLFDSYTEPNSVGDYDEAQWFTVTQFGNRSSGLIDYLKVENLPDGLPDLDGDFNGDGAVDAIDYAVWREGLGSDYSSSDFEIWRDNYGQSTSAVATLISSTPEPLTLSGFVLTGLLGVTKRRRT